MLHMLTWRLYQAAAAQGPVLNIVHLTSADQYIPRGWAGDINIHYLYFFRCVFVKYVLL
jgi:hypothetical protein